MTSASNAAIMAKMESQVLAEYAAVAANLDHIASTTHKLASIQPHLLNELRPLERKLGLVLTLFKASIWAILVQREEQAEEEELARAQYQ